MANYKSLKTTINANVKRNGNQEITGQILNSVLNAMVDTLGTGYSFAGVATPSTNPGTPDAKVFYIANSKGTYTLFGDLEVTEDDVVILYYDTDWHKESTGIAREGSLTELGKEIATKQNVLTDTDGGYGQRVAELEEKGIASQTKLSELEADAILGMAHGEKVNVPLEFVANGYLTEKGKINTSSSSKVTDFIAIDSRNKYYLSNYIHASYDCGVCYYSEANEDSFIGSQFNNDLGSGLLTLIEAELAVPTNARYIRIGTRSINYPNIVTLLVLNVDESMSKSSAKGIESRLNKQEIAINALYPYMEHGDSVNIFNKNNVEFINTYISSADVVVENTLNDLSNYMVKIDDCDGVNNTYIFKYLGSSDVTAMGLSSVRLLFANNLVAGESVVKGYSTISQTSGIKGYTTNTDKSSAYLWISFRQTGYSYDNVQSVLQDILDNIVIIKQASTDIVYPTEYVPYTDKKFVYKIDGGGGELAADQLNVITSLTYHLQSNVLTSQSAILGTGWTGSLENGYTHAVGNTEALEFPLPGMSVKARLLITFDVQGLSESNDVYISAGNSVLIKSYNGGTEIVAGLIYDGGNLKVTPTLNFAGTITNLKCRKLDDNGSETYTTNVHNVYCQRNSLVAGYWNVFIGSKTNTASKMQDGTRNIAIGYSALDAMSVGNRNISIGTYSMPFVKEGENNIAIGSDSIYPVTKAMDSISIGKGTMGGKSVERCVALGAGAMGVWDSTIERFGCTVVGASSAPAVVTGNTHVGYRAGVNTNGAYNTSIGYNSLGIGTRSSVDIVGTNLTCVGHDASVANNDTAKAANNSTALGNGATITKSNQVVIGNAQVEEVIIGGKKIIFNADGTCTWEAL